MVQAQDSILLLNGEVLKGKISEDLGDFYKFDWQRKKKTSTVAVDKNEIYQMFWSDGRQLMLYQPDTNIQGSFSSLEMMDFIYGEREARHTYKPRVPQATGFVIGGAGACLGFWGICLSPVYLGLTSIRKPGPGPSTVIPSQVKNPEIFAMGYGHAARKKKVQKTAIATAAGLITVWIVKVAADGLK